MSGRRRCPAGCLARAGSRRGRCAAASCLAGRRRPRNRLPGRPGLLPSRPSLPGRGPGIRCRDARPVRVRFSLRRPRPAGSSAARLRMMREPPTTQLRPRVTAARRHPRRWRPRRPACCEPGRPPRSRRQPRRPRQLRRPPMCRRPRPPRQPARLRRRQPSRLPPPRQGLRLPPAPRPARRRPVWRHPALGSARQRQRQPARRRSARPSQLAGDPEQRQPGSGRASPQRLVAEQGVGDRRAAGS
jgi:hypothetical protein